LRGRRPCCRRAYAAARGADRRTPASHGSRELTKAAIDDIVVRGDVTAWRKLFQAIRDDASGRLERRVREVAAAIAEQDVKAKAFAALLPRVVGPGSRSERRAR
jgi:hypothetical protein